MKIIIIGAGIAGLTLGLACQRAGFDVKIYEKTTILRNIGGGLLLWPHGLRYLQWLGLDDVISSAWVDVNKCDIVSDQNALLTHASYDAFYHLIGNPVLPIERNRLQLALYELLRPESLALGKTCVTVSETATAATVTFADGSVDTADVVVGADGIHSQLRQLIHPTLSPLDTDFQWWGGVTAQQAVPDFARDTSLVVLGVGKVFFAWPAAENKILWFLPVRSSTTSSHETLVDITAWNPMVKTIAAATLPDSCFHLPVQTLEAIPAWSSRRVTLIGDAIHAMGPVLAQGASLAIEDAYLLTQCLQNQTANITQRLHHYEALRRDRYQQFFAFENQSADMLISDSAESLITLQQQMHQVDFVEMYHELIPLVDQAACEGFAVAARQGSVDTSIV